MILVAAALIAAAPDLRALPFSCGEASNDEVEILKGSIQGWRERNERWTLVWPGKAPIAARVFAKENIPHQRAHYLEWKSDAGKTQTLEASWSDLGSVNGLGFFLTSAASNTDSIQLTCELITRDPSGNNK